MIYQVLVCAITIDMIVHSVTTSVTFLSCKRGCDAGTHASCDLCSVTYSYAVSCILAGLPNG